MRLTSNNLNDNSDSCGKTLACQQQHYKRHYASTNASLSVIRCPAAGTSARPDSSATKRAVTARNIRRSAANPTRNSISGRVTRFPATDAESSSKRPTPEGGCCSIAYVQNLSDTSNDSSSRKPQYNEAKPQSIASDNSGLLLVEERQIFDEESLRRRGDGCSAGMENTVLLQSKISHDKDEDLAQANNVQYVATNLGNDSSITSNLTKNKTLTIHSSNIIKSKNSCVIKVRSPERRESDIPQFKARDTEKPSARIILKGSIAFEKTNSDEELSIERPSRPPRRKRDGHVSRHFSLEQIDSGQFNLDSHCDSQTSNSISRPSSHPRLNSAKGTYKTDMYISLDDAFTTTNKQSSCNNGSRCSSLTYIPCLTSSELSICDSLADFSLPTTVNLNNRKDVLIQTSPKISQKRIPPAKPKRNKYKYDAVKKGNSDSNQSQFIMPNTTTVRDSSYLESPANTTFVASSQCSNAEISTENSLSTSVNTINLNVDVNVAKDTVNEGKSTQSTISLPPNTQGHGEDKMYVDVEFRTSSQSLVGTNSASCLKKRVTDNPSSKPRSRSCSPKPRNTNNNKEEGFKRSRSADLSGKFSVPGEAILQQSIVNVTDEVRSLRTDGDTDILSNEGTYLSLSWDFTDAEFLQVSYIILCLIFAF